MEKPFPAYKGDAPFVFVCYSHGDKDVVYSEIAWLQEQGVHVWYDEGISAGRVWRAEIGEAIEKCTSILFYISRSSLTSEHCNREISLGLDEEKAILPIYLEDIALTADLKVGLARVQALKRDQDPNYQQHLLGALRQSPLDETSVPRPPKRRWRPYGWAALTAPVALGLALLLWDPAYELVERATDSRAQNVPAFDRSVAITPFTVIGNSPGVQSYADGLAEELKALLTNYYDLRLVKGSSPPETASAGDVPQTSYLISGNVQSFGERLRLRVRLSRTSDGQSIWSDTYEHAMKLAIADQTQQATTVGRFVRAQLVQDHQCEWVRRKTRSMEAADAYCAARAENRRINQVGNSDPHLQLSHAQKAVALDPNVADFYQFVADAYLTLGLMQQIGLQDAVQRIHAALDQGLALEPNHSELIPLRGWANTTLDLDYSSAEEHLRRGLAMTPNNRFVHGALGQLALRRGNVAEAVEHYRRAVRLYDSDARIYYEYADALYIAGEPRKAIEAAEASLELVSSSGNSRVLSYDILVQAHLALGEDSEANAAVEEALDSAGFEWRYSAPTQLARVGRSDEARAAIAGQSNPHPDTMVFTYVALGEHDLAFEWAHKAIDLRAYMFLIRVRSHPAFAEMRQDPRWDAVMKHLEEVEGERLVEPGRRKPSQT